MGKPELASDPLFATASERLKIYDVQLIERGMITEMEMPDQMPTRKIKARGNPLKFSAVKAEMKKPPNWGQHETEILSLLGYDEADIEALKKKWSVS